MAKVTFGQEVRAQADLCLPSMLIYVTSILLWLVTFFVLGRLGSVVLAGASLGMSMTNLLGNVTTMGLSSALDIMFTQAFGAKQMDTLRSSLQRGIMIISGVCVLICILLWNGEYLLLLARQEPELAAVAGTFLRWCTLGMWPLAMYDILKRYFEAMSVLLPTLVVTGIAFAVNIVSNYVLVYVYELGVTGVGASLALSYWTLFLLLLGYYVSTQEKDIWWEVSPDAYSKWPEFFTLAVPSLVMTFFEWGSFEVSLFVISPLGPAAIAQQSIMMNACYIMYVMPSGLATATMTRVGNLLGAADAESARQATIVSGLASLLTGFSAAVVLMLLRDYWPYIYARDWELVGVVIEMTPLLAMFEITDSVQTTLGVVVKGTGRPRLGAMLTAIGFWGVSLPLGAFLALRSRQVANMWKGYIVGEVGLVLVYICALYITDWQLMVENARIRVEADGETENLLKGNHTNGGRLLPDSNGGTREQYTLQV